ncbi:membrane dipeptidase, partial [Streptosporangium roseum]|uniref:membrane dipeptidase n=1 Tax=Streptosporangium roseum TaxID=2001 RepID=UPI00331FAEA2
MQSPSASYRGHQAYGYLEPGVDYADFELAEQIGRVPAYDGGVSAEQSERVSRIMAEHIVISLHEHAVVLPKDVGELRRYNRTGRQRTGYEGLSRSGMTAVFDNFMAGASCVTSENGWKWNDMIYALGLRLADIAKQDYVVHALTVDDIRAAKRDGRMALVAGLESATMIENELDRLDILYGFGVRQIGIAYSQANQLGSGLA